MDKVRAFFNLCNPFKLHKVECHIPQQYPFVISPDPYDIFRPVPMKHTSIWIVAGDTCYPSAAKCADSIGLDYSKIRIPDGDVRSRIVDFVYKFGDVSEKIDAFADNNIINLRKVVDHVTVLQKAGARKKIPTLQAFQGMNFSDFQFVGIQAALGSFRDEVIKENKEAISRYNYARIGKNVSFVFGVIATIALAVVQCVSLINPVVKAVLSVVLAILAAFPYAIFGFFNSFGNSLMKYLTKDIKVLSEIEISVRLLFEHTKQMDRLEDSVNRLKACFDALNGTNAHSQVSPITVADYLLGICCILDEWINWFQDLKSMIKGMRTEILKLTI